MANIFTTAGANAVASYLNGTAVPATNYIGWGTGAGTAAAGDTVLSTESTEARVAATRSNPSANQVQYVGTLTAAAGKTITNAGVLSALTTGTLVLHSDFTGVVLNTGDSIQFTFTLSFS